jgi:hypothetical protein
MYTFAADADRVEEQRMAESDAKWDRRLALLDAKWEGRLAQFGDAKWGGTHHPRAVSMVASYLKSLARSFSDDY